jgi:hypothetical protein
MEANTTFFTKIADVTSVFHPLGDDTTNFSKHHQGGKLVHPVTKTEQGWVASKTLLVYSGLPTVVVVGQLVS